LYINYFLFLRIGRKKCYCWYVKKRKEVGTAKFPPRKRGNKYHHRSFKTVAAVGEGVLSPSTPATMNTNTRSRNETKTPSYPPFPVFGRIQKKVFSIVRGPRILLPFFFYILVTQNWPKFRRYKRENEEKIHYYLLIICKKMDGKDFFYHLLLLERRGKRQFWNKSNNFTLVPFLPQTA